MEEVNAILDAAEANFEAGLGIPGEDVFRELEEEFAREDAEEDTHTSASSAKEELLREAV